MCWRPGALNPRNVVPRFQRHYSQNPPDSASRVWYWNCETVHDQLPCWKWTYNPYHWPIFINRSVQLLGIPDFFRNSVLSFIENLKAPLWPLVGRTPIPPIRTGYLDQGDLTSMSQSPGVVPYLPVRRMCLGIWRTHALLHAASVMTSAILGIVSLFVDAPQFGTLLSVRGFIIVVMIGRVRLINFFVANIHC